MCCSALLAGACLLSNGLAAAPAQRLATHSAPAAPTSDKAVLLHGVGSVPLPSQPDFLCTTLGINEQPEIILTGQAEPGQPYQLIALSSSRLGRGKVLAFGSAAYFRQPLVRETQVQKLLTNALAWGSRARRPRVQVWGGDEALIALLTSKNARLAGSATALDTSADILLLSREIADTVQLRRIEQFVRRGGTLLYASPLPDAQRATPQAVLEMPFNTLLEKAGLLQIVYPSMMYAHKGFLSGGPLPDYLGMPNVLRSIRDGRAPAASQFNEYGVFSFTLDMAVALNPADSPTMSRLKQVVHYQADSLLVPTKEKPVKSASREFLHYHVQHRLLEKQLRKHPNPAYVAPAAATFPGAVPATAARISTELALPVRVGSNGTWEPGPGYRWPHSTGLYVPAGEKVVIYLTGKDSLRQLVAQVGVHSDDLTHLPQITREAFDLTRRFELKHGRTEVYSPYGGVLLLNIPDTTTLSVLLLKVQGAVQAPRFERGKTSLAAWQNTIRQYPAPWAELVSDNIILTVPSARIRTLDDPEKVVAFWDAVLATMPNWPPYPRPAAIPSASWWTRTSRTVTCSRIPIKS